MSRELLTDDKRHLKLFDDGVSINKNLQKWKRAEEHEEKTESPKIGENEATNIVNSGNIFNIQMSNDGEEIPSNNGRTTAYSTDVDSEINSGTRWLPLYQTPEGLSFDEIASAGIKDLTKLIVEKKIKYVMAGYGSFGSTRNDNIKHSDQPHIKFLLYVCCSAITFQYFVSKLPITL